jgi:hypothetical protein
MSTETRPGRRELRFESLDDAVRDAETLLARGYDRAGNWDLAQVCDHLADWLTYPVAGFPRAPLPIRMMLGLVRMTLGRGMFEKYLKVGMPAGKPTMPQSVHAAGEDPAAAIMRLREAARRFTAHAGEYPPSPLFGKLTRDEALKLQLAHTAHHLSFLVPKP